MMRSVLSYSFCEAHRGTEDYLHRNCYTSAREYLRDEESFEGDLDWMVNTLEHHARGVEGDAGVTDVRVSHYRRQYDGVPLWVLFNELTFGNLKYFYALLRKNEQNVVCNRIWEACGHAGSSPISRRGMLLDLDEMVAVRNICAHDSCGTDAADVTLEGKRGLVHVGERNATDLAGECGEMRLGDVTGKRTIGSRTEDSSRELVRIDPEIAHERTTREQALLVCVIEDEGMEFQSSS